jgi:hypothetical protein
LTYLFESDTVEFSSPYGGIVYFVSPPGGEIELEFSDVSKYPVLHRGSWNGTDQFSAPFAELCSDFVILTVPTPLLPNLPTICSTCTFLDDLIDFVVHFTGEVHEYRYRVIFDIELANESAVCGNPIVFSYDQFAPLFDSREPSGDLFCLLMFVAVLSLPPDAFSDEDEACIAAIAAGAAFRTKWATISPFTYSPDDLPERAAKLWTVYCTQPGEKAIPKALEQARNAKLAEGEAMWDKFVYYLGKTPGLSVKTLVSTPVSKSQKEERVLPGSSPNLKQFSVDRVAVARFK